MFLIDGGYWSPDSGYLKVNGNWQFWADGDITPNKNDGTAFRVLHQLPLWGLRSLVLHSVRVPSWYSIKKPAFAGIKKAPFGAG